MSITGGSIEAVGLAGRTFEVDAESDVGRQIGGFSNAVNSFGSGNARKVKTRKPWMLSNLTVGIDDDRGDQEFLQGLANSNEFFAITITFASGETYQGVGTITDDIQYKSKESQAEISLSGPRTLTKQ